MNPVNDHISRMLGYLGANPFLKVQYDYVKPTSFFIKDELIETLDRIPAYRCSNEDHSLLVIFHAAWKNKFSLDNKDISSAINLAKKYTSVNGLNSKPVLADPNQKLKIDYDFEEALLTYKINDNLNYSLDTIPAYIVTENILINIRYFHSCWKVQSPLPKNELTHALAIAREYSPYNIMALERLRFPIKKLGKFFFPSLLRPVENDLFTECYYSDKQYFDEQQLKVIDLVIAAFQNDLKLHINYHKKARAYMDQYHYKTDHSHHRAIFNNRGSRDNFVPSKQDFEDAQKALKSNPTEYQANVCNKIIFGRKEDINLPMHLREDFYNVLMDLAVY